MRAKIPIPQFEGPDGIDAQTIHSKITEFYDRLPKCSSDYADFMHSYFLELLRYYPKSLCSRGMTDSLKLLISIWYQDSKLATENFNKENGSHYHGVSYEDLAILFVRSKASIHDAIEARGNEALYTVKAAREARISKQNREQAPRETNVPQVLPGGKGSLQPEL